jgi:LCP family protein required for cell wall assembly
LQRKRKHWPRRKKIAFFLVLLMVLTPFLAAGAYVWQITNAIEDVQDQSVVSFPKSQMELGGVSRRTETNATPQASPQAEAIQAAPTATEGPTRTSGNPGSIGIARDIIGTGIRADVVNPAEAWPGRKYINVLVLGIDTRAAEGDQNADVIMIARVDFSTNEVRVVSIPRDLQVEVPGHGPSKINGAYNIGVTGDRDNKAAGVLMMRDTIEYNFGVPIDEFVLVDFAGFEKVIDAVGGIIIDVPERIEDDAYPTEDFGTTTLVIEEGRQEMLVLRALLEKGQSLGSVTRVAQVINATGDAVITSIDWKEQLALVNIALKVDQNQIVMENITEPLVVPGTAADGAWIYVGDPDEIAAFIESVLSGADPDA